MGNYSKRGDKYTRSKENPDSQHKVFYIWYRAAGVGLKHKGLKLKWEYLIATVLLGLAILPFKPALAVTLIFAACLFYALFQ